MAGRLLVAVLAACLIAGAGVARAADGDAVAACDALAAEPSAATPGVPLEAIDADTALVACATAIEEQPGEPRLVHQYARALERAGRIADARRAYAWAAADLYAPAGAALARLGPAPADDGFPAADRQRLADAVAALSATARRFGNALPPDPADPLTILAETGPDPEAMRAWIASETRLIPYSGSLRGAGGVLVDRAGNSLDRALALAALLTAAGEEVRLAHATLDPAIAAALLASAATATPAIQPAPPRVTADELRGMLADPRIQPDVAAAIVAAVTERQRSIANVLAERTATVLPAVLAAVPAPAPAAAPDPAELAATADHTWVQIRAGAAWRDLDPDAAIVGTLVPDGTRLPDQLLDSDRQSVTIRVVVELQDDTGRHEAELLAWTGAPAEIGNRVLTLSHVGTGTAGIAQLVAEGATPERVLAALDEADTWMPILRFDDSFVVANLFTAEGTVRPANLDAFGATGGTMAGLLADVTEALGGAPAVAPPPAIPTAEWIEVTVNVPGAPPRTERRTIFDLVGPSARAAGTPVTPTPDQLRDRALRLTEVSDILVAGATPSDLQNARIGMDELAAVGDGIRAAVSLPVEPTLDDYPDVRIGLALRQFASDRLAGDPTLALASPNVFMTHERLVWDPASGAAHQSEFDIVFNDVFAPDAFAARLRQGVIDTILEDALFGDGGGRNASALQAADTAAGRPWQAYAAGDAARIFGAGSDAATAIEADLAAGRLVVGPPVAGTAAGWWRIDPVTGTAVGMMLGAGGATLAEAAFLFAEGFTSMVCFMAVGAAVAYVMGVPGLRLPIAVGGAMCMVAGGLGLVSPVGLGVTGFGGAAAVLGLGIGSRIIGRG